MEKIRAKCTSFVNKINQAPVGRIDWILLAVMAAFMLVTMFYGDLIIIYNHSLTFLDSLFSFDMINFYANSLERPYYGFGAVYYWMVYAVIGVWNLPIWILNKLFGINMFSIKCLLWSKLQIVAFLILTCWILERLLRDFGFSKEKCRFTQFLFASSLMVILPTVAISQIDIITVFLMLLGIHEYVQTDRITWKFLLIYSFAASLKIFALFVFFPLVLLREKRILHVIWDFLMGIVFIMLCLLPYAGRADYKEATSILNDAMVERMFSTTLPTGNIETPAFLAILVGISIWAYVQRVEERESYFYYANWIALAVFADFFVFVFAHPYWIVLLAPYMILLLVINADRMKINVLLEFFTGTAVSVFYWATFGVYMTEETFANLILPRFGVAPERTGYFSLNDWLVQKEMETYISVLFAIFTACLIAFLILNRPGKSACLHVEEELKVDHGMIYLRLGMILVYILGCVYFAYIN